MSFEPSDAELADAVREIWQSRPESSAKYLHKVIKIKHPNWQLSETRVKKFVRGDPIASHEEQKTSSQIDGTAPSRPASAPLTPERGFVLKPKRNGCFIIRHQGRVIDCTASTGRWWDGRQPAAWAIDGSGCFDVRIQTAGTQNPIMVSTECKSICFQVELNEGTGLRDLFAMISRYPDFGGRMAYFSARVTAPHTLFVFSDRIFTRNWDDATIEARREQVPQRQPIAAAAPAPSTNLLSRSPASMSVEDLAVQLPAAASAFMSRLADSHYGLREHADAEACRRKDQTLELQRLRAEGTDTARNEADPFGDGDQTPIRFDGATCAHSALWAAGGDLMDLVEEGRAPAVVLHLLSGNASQVGAAVERARADGCLTQFLEKRFGLLRSTPLMLVVAGCGQEFRSGDSSVRVDYFETMQLLLAAGARVDARDLCGKTVLHYLVGPLFKEPLGWDMLRACIATSQQLQLQPPLVDVQDRFGVTVVLYAVIMNLTKLVKTLCDEYSANTTIADWSGVSAHSFPTLNGDIKRTIAKSSARTVAAIDTCCLCRAATSTQKCSGCNVARYCSQKCQSDDWAAHSKVCRSSKTASACDEGFVMRPKLGQPLASLSKSLTISKWDGLLPPNLKVEKGFFEIKVQTGAPTQAMMVYTKHKEICFTVEMNEGENLPALHAKIAAYAAYGGRKAYFFAKHVRKGELLVSGKQMFSREW